jgi:uncharacterized membrane protein YccC
MKNFLPMLDATRLSIALKTCLALILGFAITLQLDWKPSFMAILIVVLQTDALGATLKKGLLYIAGTLGGAATGVVMVGLFAHDRGLFILGMAVLTGLVVYRMQGSRYVYAWLIFIVTSALIGWLAAQNTGTTFSLAIMRASTVCVGVIVSFSVHAILWPIKAGRTFERQLHEYLEGCRNLLSFTIRAVAGDAPNAAAVKKVETAQVKTITELRNSLEAAAGDTTRFKRFHAGYLALIERLRELLLAILAVHEGIARRIGGKAGRSPTADANDLGCTLKTVEGQMETLIRDLARPRDGTGMDREPDTFVGPVIDKPGMIDTATEAMIAGEVAVMASRIAQVRASLARVEDPGQASGSPPPPPRKPFRLTSAKSRKAVGGSLVIVLMGSFFSLTQWPMGLSLGMVFGTLAIGFGAMLPLAMIRRQLLLSLVIGPAIAAPLYFGVMPRINQYEALIPWLCIAFLPLLYMQTSRNPKTMIQSIFSSIFLIALLQLDAENQSYDFSSFLTMWFGFCGGFTISLAIFSLFSSVVPEREFWKQVRSFFGGCGQFMQGLKGSAPGTPERAAIITTSEKRWQGTLKQLHTWSSSINYKRVPGNNRQQTQALIESIEYLALRLASAEDVCQQSLEALDGSIRKPCGRIYDACIESVRLITNSLANLQPIPDLPDTGSLVSDIASRGDDLHQSAVGDEDVRSALLRFMSTTAHLRALADAIHECRDKANALDWEAWNRDYF